MTAYLIGTIDVEDSATYDLYRSFNPSLVEAAGGKYIIKGKPVTALEGDDFRSRFVMIEFASGAALRRFYDSTDYAALRPIRQSSAKSSLAFIDMDSDSSDRTTHQIAQFGDNVTLTPITTAMNDLGPNDLRIQPTLISVNPIDWKIRSGLLAVLPISLPYTPGCEGVGIIEAVGAQVEGFSPGQRVMAHSGLVRGGWFANRVDVDSSQCALVPEDMTDENAAALSVALLTANQSIMLHTGTIERALVIGASGSVGSMATALLRRKTKHVDAICSASNVKYVETLGGNVLPPEQAAQAQYDFVLDAAGGPVIEAGYRNLAPGGTLVSIVQPVDEARAKAASAQAIRYSVTPNGDQLVELITQHQSLPDPRIAAFLPLAEVNAALHLCRFGRPRGKILLRP